MTTHSHKIVTKVTECLRQVIVGLPVNDSLEAKTLMIFIHGICNDSIPRLNQNVQKKAKELQDVRHQPTDTFIIPPEPKRAKVDNCRSGPRTNTHVLVEFGLQVSCFFINIFTVLEK